MRDPLPSGAVLDPDDLRVSRLRAVRGPNLWRLGPVIACDLTLGGLEEVPATCIPGFEERLTARLPTLRARPCPRGTEGGFVAGLREGMQLPHVLEHVALELQALAGSDVAFGRAVRTGDPGVWWLVVAYGEEEVGLQAVREALRLVRACISGEPYAVDEVVDALHELHESVRLGPSTAAIVEEARSRGIPVRRLNRGSLVQLGLGVNLRRVQAAMSDGTSAIAVEIAQDKDDTRRVLGAIGLPVPEGRTASTVDGALEAARELGYPVLLKPLDASHGRGISGALDGGEGVRAAFDAARQHSRRVVVEQFVTGRDHRVLVVDGRVAAVAERVPAHVTGDGRSTVAQLIARGNQDPRRGKGHARTLTRLPDDAATDAYLRARGLSQAHVPAAGERVPLRATANLSTGGTSIDRTDEIHPDNATACERAAGAVGLDIAGIDVLSPDIRVPFRENGAVIIEVNAAPGLRMHTHPTEGVPRRVAAPIVRMLYPPGQPCTIPVIAVTGTNGKTTTTRLIAHLFRQAGKTVGFTTTDGVYLQDRMVMEGDMTGPVSANVVLSNPAVEVAVLETARGGILRAGLGFDACDVGVVLNVAADHLGLGGIHTLDQMAELKSVVPAVVRHGGHAVLNADDPRVHAMRERSAGEIVLFSTLPPGESPRFDEHVEGGGTGARIEDGELVVRRGRLRIPIAGEREVPLMMGGVARFQRQNVLAAIAAAYVREVDRDLIRAGLLSFFPSPSMTPGRLNLLRMGDARVLVDYAHNPAAVAGLVEMVMEIPARRRVGVITAPRDRRDEDIRGVGRLCAELDRVIVREDADARGRPAGEVVRLVIEGLRQGGMRAGSIDTEVDEIAAVDRALAELGPGDLLMVLVDQVPRVLAHLRELVGGGAA